MIKEWRVHRFKSVSEATALEMTPLTIFAGANSSGKSTIIQSLLLTTQTIQNSVSNRPVILNGHILRLGTFNDIVSNGGTEPIGLGFTLGLDLTEEDIFRTRTSLTRLSADLKTNLNLKCDFKFSPEGDSNEKELLQLQPRLEELSLELKGQSSENILEGIFIKRSKRMVLERLSNLSIADSLVQRVDQQALEYEIITTTRQKTRRRYPYDPISVIGFVGVLFRHFLPDKLAYTYDALDEQISTAIQLLVDERLLRYSGPNPELEKLLTLMRPKVDEVFSRLSSSDLSFKNAQAAIAQDFSYRSLLRFHSAIMPSSRVPLAQAISDSKEDLKQLGKGKSKPEIKIGYFSSHETSEISTEYIHSFFSSKVKYLGPLRDEPKPVYPLAGAIDTQDIGFRGEHTAAVLEIHRNKIIKYIPSAEFGKNSATPGQKEETLNSAVLDWLAYLGIASNVVTKDQGKLGHEMRVSIGEGEPQDLTHVGVGVSQVLPILVLSLLAEEGTTLIFEQPELHLQPRVQTRLADFFVSLTLMKKQCIVETHSEYLINRLRYRSAVSSGDALAKDCIIYFVEKEGLKSKYRPVRINRYGVIEEWPKGFFDEDEELSASILKAGMEKRKRDKAQK